MWVDTVLGQTVNFRKCRSILFAQVLHDGNLHYIAISTYGVKQGKVIMMDSMFRGKVADHTKTQICAIKLLWRSAESKSNFCSATKKRGGLWCFRNSVCIWHRRDKLALHGYHFWNIENEKSFAAMISSKWNQRVSSIWRQRNDSKVCTQGNIH